MDFSSALENIYISPLELCNLHCQYCYTPKTKNILSHSQILSFVKRYQSTLSKFAGKFLTSVERGDTFTAKKKVIKNLRLNSIIFCGGEVFTLKNFPRLINHLHQQNIFTTIITNGTIDRLKSIKDPKNCQLLVSFDGPEAIHDANRGPGNFAKSQKFVAHALKLGFPVEIFFLITKNSYPYKDSFELFNLPKTYLIDRLGSLTPDQVKIIRQNYRTFPPKNFGCNTLSLQSDGKFYGCCETSKSLGTLTDPLDQIINKFLTLDPVCNDIKFKCNFLTL